MLLFKKNTKFLYCGYFVCFFLSGKMFSDYSNILKKELDCPKLEDVQKGTGKYFCSCKNNYQYITKLFTLSIVFCSLALLKGLKNNFSTANVEIVDCPDLTEEPFYLASKGI